MPTGVLTLTIAFVLAAGSITPAQNNWKRIDTPNFVAIGDVSAGNLRDVVTKFEGFRETLGRIHGPRMIGSTVPTVIIVFPSETAMEPFRPIFNGKPVDVGGLFVGGNDVNFMSIIDDGNKERMRVVFHEYTHSVSNNSSRRMPLWLEEGFAEYYSTFEPLRGGREALIGEVISEHIARLNDTVLIPIAELLKLDHSSPLYNEGSRRSVFYAQSWALLHMLLRGEPSRAPQLGAYLDRVNAGEEPVAAWQAAFAGLNMDQEFAQYIRRQSYLAVKYLFGEALTKYQMNPTSMTPVDVQGFLADFQATIGDADSATKRLAEIAKRDPANARATVTAARMSVRKGQAEEIGDKLKKMPPPADWYLAYLAGVTLADQVSRAAARPTAEDVEAVEKFLAVARASGREFPNGVASVAQLEVQAVAQPTAEAEAAIERARKLSPARDDYAFLHAQILLRRRDFGKARSILGGLLASGTPEVKASARQMLAQIAEYENALSANRSAAAPELSRIPTGAAPPPPRQPVPDTPMLLFRQTKPGEQRLESVIHNIECVVGKGITFHFKSGEQAVTATATKFDDVEFITYRDDLRGSVTCGPTKEPMKVYLTWKPGPVDGSKLAVAIEFLPKDK